MALTRIPENHFVGSSSEQQLMLEQRRDRDSALSTGGGRLTTLYHRDDEDLTMTDQLGWEPPAFFGVRVLNPQRYPGDSPSVLVVDDNDSVRWSVMQLLRSEGYEVIEARDGTDALRALNSHRVAAMVLDLRMPHLDGGAVLRALDNPPPTVVLSATELDDTTRQDVEEALAAELKKPVPPDRLLDAVATAVAAISLTPAPPSGSDKEASASSGQASG
jgi:CheY-like chemotaxis protein